MEKADDVFLLCCGKALKIKGDKDKKNICPYCQSDIHCCYNCTFYDTEAPNKCHKPGVSFVSDKAEANLCHDFVMKKYESPPCNHEEDIRMVKAKVDALFKKSA